MSDPVVVPVVRDINSFAQKVAEIAPTYKVKEQRAQTFRNLTLIEDEKTNWKKGLIYLISRYSKGISLEFWLYSTKKGAHLAEFNDQFRALAKDGIECEALGHAVKLRTKIPDGMSDTDMEAKIKHFTETIEPVAQEVRSKIIVSVKESKKEEAKIDTSLPEGSVVEGQVQAETPVPVTESKKSGKSKSKAKAKAA